MRRSAGLALRAARSLAAGGLAFCAAPLLGCQGSRDDSQGPSSSDVEPGTTLTSPLVLLRVAEKKLSKLLPTKAIDHYEASGIAASNGQLFVVSDNLSRVAIIDTSLEHGELGPGSATESQYEALTASDDGRFFAMAESVSESDPRGQVVELGADTAQVGAAFTDTEFQHLNNGFEGLAWLRKGSTEYLLALCENNECKDDDSTPGEGRVKVLTRQGDIWMTQASLKLPESVRFLNYSDLALRDNGDGSYVAGVVSRKSSALWVGRLTTSPWAFSGSGTFYVLPRAPDGTIEYCSAEGVTFLGPHVLALVSDESDGSAPCSDTEESIHIFEMPQ